MKKSIILLVISSMGFLIYVAMYSQRAPQKADKSLTIQPEPKVEATAVHQPVEDDKGRLGVQVQTTVDTQTARFVEVNGISYQVNTGDTAGFVNDAACQSCHPSIYKSFQKVAMAKSFYLPAVGNVIENFDDAHYYHELSNRHYEMEIRDGKYIQRRYQIAPDGQRINTLEQTVDYIMGSGNHVRTYLYRNEAGEIYQLPLAWYSQTQQWRMNPGYDRADHDGFMRLVQYECMFCHNGNPDIATGNDYQGAPVKYPKQLPHGIGCQRCHGPGEDHINIANDDDSTLDEVRFEIVNPGKLSPRLRDDVCLQCHLLPTSNIPSTIRKFDRGYFSYRPGEPLRDYQVVVDYHDVSPGHERFEINHHPYRLYQSQCYLSSPGQMSCMTCHDPHRKIPVDQQTSYYQEKCLSCHVLSDCGVKTMATNLPKPFIPFLESNDCVKCHMPERRPEDVILVTMTDHMIQRGPPDQSYVDPMVENDPPAVKPPFFYDPEVKLPEPLGSLYMALMYQFDSPEVHAQRLQEMVNEVSWSNPAAYRRLAFAQSEAEKWEDARDTYLLLLEKFPDDVPGLLAMGEVNLMLGQFEQSLKFLRRALAISPDIPYLHYRLASALYSLGEQQKGIVHWKEAIRLRPNYENALFDYATILHWSKRQGEAVDHYKKILAISPTDEEAYVRLSVALMEVGEAQEATQYIQHANSLITDNPKIQMVLSMALAFDRKFDDAAKVANQAIENGAAKTNAYLILAFIKHAQGQKELAKIQYKKAQEYQTQVDSKDILFQFIFQQTLPVMAE